MNTFPSRFAFWLGVGLVASLAAPAACFFPDYSFDEPEPSGSGGTSSNNGGGGMASGSTTSTGNMGGNGGSGGMPNPENCTNGVDDDADGNADCMDPKCSPSHLCVPEVPMDWTGYIALYDGASAQDPGCPNSFPDMPSIIGNRNVIATPATCTCTCGPPQGQTCAALSSIVVTTSDALCGQNDTCVGSFQNLPPANWDGSCFNQGYFAGGQLTCGPNATMTCSTNTGDPCLVAVNTTAVAASGGSCQANPVVTNLPQVNWQALGRSCGLPMAGQGCNIGQSCVPRPQVPYETGVCVYQAGDMACPAGAFSEKHLFYSGVDDTRSCVDNCTCLSPAGGQCPSTVTIYSSPATGTCSGAIATLAAGTCANIAGNPNVAGRTATAPGAPQGGTCAGTGGQPSGNVTPINPVTVCCIP